MRACQECLLKKMKKKKEKKNDHGLLRGEVSPRLIVCDGVGVARNERTYVCEHVYMCVYGRTSHLDTTAAFFFRIL